MATIKGQMFGDIKGKIGGMVMTRSKAGKMIRARVQPTDAKSPAQVNTRGLFSQSMSLWNSLTTQAKRQWNSFAGTIFRSKSKKKGSTPSGSIAFASSNFALNMANSHFMVAAFSPTTITATMTQLANSVIIPAVKKFSAFLTNTAATLIPIKLSSSTLTLTSRILSSVFTFPNGAPGAGTVFKNLAADDAFSLSFYLTKANQLSYTGQILKGAYLLGNTGQISTVTGLDAALTFTINMTILQSYLDSIKSSFPTGSTGYLHVYAVSSKGQFAKVGTCSCAIT